MRSSVTLQARACGVVATTVAMFMTGLGVCAVAADGFADSLVAGLAGTTDLEPASAKEDFRGDVPAVAPQSDRSKSFARQSVPARDRAAAYRDAELFRNSKAALPLLVADLEATVSAGLRPMSGRSVGARPAAAWTRPTAAFLSVDPEFESPKRSMAAPSSFGQR